MKTAACKITKIRSYFTTYEKCWFISITVLAVLFAVIFPEEDVNGINGRWIMALYLIDTFANVLCELLISKQSRWNFIVSVAFVEVAEILICLLLAYRFATMAETLFFWIPIDIISFISWTRHPDREKEELTEVRELTGKAKVLIIIGVIIWTVGVGALMVYVTENITVTDFFSGNRDMEITVCYLDAFCSALGILNGVFIFFRIKEQWLAWFLYAIDEAIINIISGQYVLLVLKAGYLSNTIYGYIKWTKYIKDRGSTQRKEARQQM